MRKMVIVSVSIASVLIGGCILAGAAMLQYKPTQQHVEVQITKQSWDRFLASPLHLRQRVGANGVPLPLSRHKMAAREGSC